MLKKIFFNKKIRSYLLISLVFSFLLLACKENGREQVKPEARIVWGLDPIAPVGLLIPRELLNDWPEEYIRKNLEVRLHDNTVPVIGDIDINADEVVFEPLIAFTWGLQYEVYLADKLIASIEIPQKENTEPPQIISIYPSVSTVPENLLKMYIEFSKPMQEGHAMENLVMVEYNKDTVSVFLDLQQELWNKEGTILTLWLDPGRIKRGLQPNEKLGNPLQRGGQYRLLVNKYWRDREGQPIALYIKDIVVGPRDSISPSINNWEIISPKAGSKEALKIKLQESLDYLLLKNTVRIVDNSSESVVGTIETEANETILVFTPAVAWSAGNYILEVEGRLEDLAGNNLNRLFDEDISKPKSSPPKEIHTRSFTIK